jgi:membrane protein implicated in regulation of membrane protease activity
VLAGVSPSPIPKEEEAQMLWLIAGIVLLAISIAGGVIVHPVLFAFAVVAIVMFFMHFRGGRTVY